MNILVPVKSVIDVELNIRVKDGKVAEDGMNYILSKWDENAVEAALQLKEKHGGEVTVVSIGPDRAGEALRKALAMGADKAIHVNDSAAEYDVHLEIWNLNTNDIAEPIGSCLNVMTRGENVQCLVSSVPQKTLTANQVVRIRVVHSSAGGKVSIDYDNSGTATGDSRTTIPPVGIPEFQDAVLPVLATVLVPIVWRWSHRRRSKRARGAPG